MDLACDFWRVWSWEAPQASVSLMDVEQYVLASCMEQAPVVLASLMAMEQCVSASCMEQAQEALASLMAV